MAKVNTIDEIRRSFLSYFKENQHKVMPSAPLVPEHDPTLLFTTAGMVPFKDFFSGVRTPPANRLASVQKCLRTTDLEEVGNTTRHLSFFEMLGNFSFGDYFKKEAIEFAWEFVTTYLPFPERDIHISIFQDDDEAYDIWHKHIGIPDTHIKRLGHDDNFWGPAGDTGACGPSSELYLDRGDAYGPDLGGPGSEGERFMEFWNLVFNQFNYNGSEYLPLKQTGIDTGAGLERLGTLVQGVDSVFDTDELKSLRDAAINLYSTDYEAEHRSSVRIVTDHIRTLSFAISDGVLPSNEGRGYVLRRVLRRALLHGKKLGQQEPLLHKLVDKVVEIYGGFYPQLNAQKTLVQEYVLQEENRFLDTLTEGESRMQNLFARAEGGEFSNNTLPGKEVFLLYDTYGFPPEMTRELAGEKGYSVDFEGFEAAMEEQRARGRAAWKGAAEDLPKVDVPPTVFTGYNKTSDEGKVIALYKGTESVSEIKESSDHYYLITDHTPFYAESGGQLGDQGTISGASGSAEVIDVRKSGDAFVHIIRVNKGTLHTGETVSLNVDNARRQSLRNHHSATHLLNAALRRRLGDHVRQSGSLVSPDYLRFDFTQPSALSDEDVLEVENDVNEKIRSAISVETLELDKDEAEKRGAVMTFGEKYGDIVRVVEMGDASKEFCGGTHVANTADIGAFAIVKESSPGAGNRRVEAVTGEDLRTVIHTHLKQITEKLSALTGDLSAFSDKKKQLTESLESLLVRADSVPSAGLTALFREVRTIESDVADLEKEWKTVLKKEAKKSVDFDESLLDEVLSQEDKVKIFAGEGVEIGQMKNMADALRKRNADSIYLLGSHSGDQWSIVFAGTKNTISSKGMDLASILKESISASGAQGGGGGRPEMAQGAGKHDGDSAELIGKMLAHAKGLLIEKL